MCAALLTPAVSFLNVFVSSERDWSLDPEPLTREPKKKDDSASSSAALSHHWRSALAAT